MKDIQGVFNKIQMLKDEMKEIRKAYKDALDAFPGYKEVNEEMKKLRAQRKDMENVIKEEFASELSKMEDLKIDLETEKELLNDIALSTMMKGETVQVTDKYDNSYEPQFSVSFKKA
jgi:hypothetical protein